MQRVRGINIIKIDQSYISLNIDKKIKIYPLLRKTNNQARQIICLIVVSRYNFHYLKKLFIKSFSW